MEEREIITLGADVGGKDAHIATHKYVLALRKYLKQECQKVYSDSIQEFALVLRIDGSVQSWGKTGVENIVFQKRKKYITADIFMPKEVWIDTEVLKTFLASQVREAVFQMEEYIRQENVSIAVDDLNFDLNRAIDKFLETAID